MYIEEALLTICFIFGHSKAFTIPLNNALYRPGTLVPLLGHPTNATTNTPPPWPGLNHLIKLPDNSAGSAAMVYTRYGPILTDVLKEPTVNALDELWFRLGPYFPVRPIGDPPETIVEKNVTLYIEMLDWILRSYIVADAMADTREYVYNNGAREVSGVIGPIDKTGKFEAKASFRLTID